MVLLQLLFLIVPVSYETVRRPMLGLSIYHIMKQESRKRCPFGAKLATRRGSDSGLGNATQNGNDSETKLENRHFANFVGEDARKLICAG